VFVGRDVFEAVKELRWTWLFTRSDKRCACSKQPRRGKVSRLACWVMIVPCSLIIYSFILMKCPTSEVRSQHLSLAFNALWLQQDGKWKTLWSVQCRWAVWLYYVSG